jgi:hypothetical protein
VKCSGDSHESFKKHFLSELECWIKGEEATTEERECDNAKISTVLSQTPQQRNAEYRAQAQ